MGLADLFRPAPSLFDVFAMGILSVNFLKDSFQREIFFIFYIIFLLSFAASLKEKRHYQNIWLTLILLWSFAGVFIHSFYIYKGSITMRYLNLYLLSEGFIYILFGVLFFVTVIRYSTNIRFVYLLSPILLIPWIKDHSMQFFADYGRHTLIVSFLLSVLIYLFLRKKYKFLSVIILFLTVLLFFKFDVIRSRFLCRPYVFEYLIKSIINHPFVGAGFNKGLAPDNAIFGGYWGGVYKHNDYLSIGAYLGLPIVFFIIMFVRRTIRDIKLSIWLIPFLTIAIMSFFQMTMFDIAKAVSCVFITILCVLRAYKKKEALDVQKDISCGSLCV